MSPVTGISAGPRYCYHQSNTHGAQTYQYKKHLRIRDNNLCNAADVTLRLNHSKLVLLSLAQFLVATALRLETSINLTNKDFSITFLLPDVLMRSLRPMILLIQSVTSTMTPLVFLSRLHTVSSSRSIYNSISASFIVHDRTNWTRHVISVTLE